MRPAEGFGPRCSAGKAERRLVGDQKARAKAQVRTLEIAIVNVLSTGHHVSIVGVINYHGFHEVLFAREKQLSA